MNILCQRLFRPFAWVADKVNALFSNAKLEKIGNTPKQPMKVETFFSSESPQIQSIGELYEAEKRKIIESSAFFLSLDSITKLKSDEKKSMIEFYNTRKSRTLINATAAEKGMAHRKAPPVPTKATAQPK
ncbi:hypothetical protein [Candidatus Regiella insecticola]|uniref:hypothetical protein n=1 Tax=Candidatus Regiella insecticola TaxID=138073 RepID=UPI0005876615|nr:hypothetical protein [Candidatus Regiella insecticola]